MKPDVYILGNTNGIIRLLYSNASLNKITVVTQTSLDLDSISDSGS